MQQVNKPMDKLSNSPHHHYHTPILGTSEITTNTQHQLNKEDKESKKRSHDRCMEGSEGDEEQSRDCKSLKLEDNHDYHVLLNRLREIEKEKVVLIEEFTKREAMLEKERLEILTMMSIGNVVDVDDPMKPIHLNVGGNLMTVRLGLFWNSSREPNNALDKMLKGILPIHETPSLLFEERVFFIDCDISIFKMMIEWLKSGECDDLILALSELDRKLVLRACDELGFENLKKHVIEMLSATATSEQQQLQDISSSINQLVLQSNIVDSTVLNELFEKHVKSKNEGLLYRGSRDGFKACNFHKHCDKQGKALTIVHSRNGQIFGGYTSQPWESIKCWKTDPSAFIFKIDSQLIARCDIKSESYRTAINCDSNCLPCFGFDFHIVSQCNENSYSYSNFGNSYHLPTGFTYESEQARKFLAGSCKFQVLDIEVFKVL